MDNSTTSGNIGSGYPTTGSASGADLNWGSGSVATEPVLAPAPPTVPRRRWLPVVGVLAGLGIIGGGAAFAFSQLRGPEANTPEQAVETMLASLASGDAIGLAESLAPGERDVLIDSMVPMFGELERLDVLAKDLDLRKVRGFSGEVKDFKATSKPLRDDLAEVRVTGGSLTTRFDPKEFPFGKVLRELFGDEIDKSSVAEDANDITSRADEVGYVTVKEGRRWYVSIGYSIAEDIRRDSIAGFAVPKKGAGVIPKGAATPEDAVGEMVDALADLNLRRVIELLPPDEFAPLQEYASAFLEDAEAGVREIRDMYELKFPELEMSVKESNGKAFVKIIRSGVDFSLTDPNGPPVVAQFRKNCLTLTLDNDTKKRCGADIAKFAQDFGLDVDQAALEKSLAEQKKLRADTFNSQIGLRVVKSNGMWFVSPTRSMLDSITATLETLSPEDLKNIEERVEKQISELTSLGGLGGSTDSTIDTSPTLDTSPIDTDSDPTFDTLPGAVDTQASSVDSSPTSKEVDAEIAKILEELEAMETAAAEEPPAETVPE